MKLKEYPPIDIPEIARMLNKQCDYHIPEEMMINFLSMGKPVYLNKWESLIRNGDIDDNIYVVCGGLLRSWYRNGEHDKTSGFASVPTIFMEYHSFYGKKPSFYEYQACSPMSLLRISKRDYNHMLNKWPELSRWMLRMTEGQLFYHELRDEINAGTAKDRYEQVLRDRPHLLNMVPLHIIASYMGITPQYLSKLRKQYGKE